MSIEYQPFVDFKAIVQQEVAPEDLAEEMQMLFRDQVGNALSDIQTIIPWFRDMNVNFYQKGNVEEFCAANIFQGPVGKATQLFAYKPGKDCRKFWYKRVTTAEIECWIERQRCTLCNFETPPSAHIYDSPYCNYVFDGQTPCSEPYITPPEDDRRFQCLDDDQRIFAVGPDYKVFVAPRFPCDYVLTMQWQGIRRKWEDDTPVPVDQQMREAVVNYVEHKVAIKEKDRAAFLDYRSLYSDNLRILKFRYHDEQDTELKRDCSAAIEQIMAASRPLYETSVFGPYGTYFPYLSGPTAGGVTSQVYAGNTYPTFSPQNPQQAAIFYFLGQGTILTWDITNQVWV